MTNTHPDKTTKRKTLTGEVMSNKMQDTVIVLVKLYKKHYKYEKHFLRGKRYKVHDKGNMSSVGDKVVIEECRPFSKEKKFTIVKNLSG